MSWPTRWRREAGRSEPVAGPERAASCQQGRLCRARGKRQHFGEPLTQALREERRIDDRSRVEVGTNRAHTSIGVQGDHRRTTR
jgi:hypothetical protein